MKKLLCLVFLMATVMLYAQPDLDFVSVASNFNRPVDLTGAGDGTDRLFVVEKAGRIKIIDLTTETVLLADFLNIVSKVDDAANEQGLLGLAFDPNYTTNGYFYVNYTYDPGPGLDRTRISRFSVSANPNLADASSEHIILEIAQDFGNHNGGDINFGPDGYLYIGMGDGGSGGDPNCRAQDPAELLGKMLRIDVHGTPPINGAEMCGLVQNYGIPVSNPFSNPGDGVCDEIWAVGLRNPWRFSFDAITNDMWIGDVGQNSKEEIDFQPAASAGGENYGWKIMEASNCFDSDPIDVDCPMGVPSCFDGSFINPVFEYTHSLGCSVTGGYVYRGSQFSNMQGYYIFMDYCTNRIWTLTGTPGNWNSTVKLLNGYGNITSFGEDDDHEIYAANDGLSASVYRLVDLSIPVAVHIESFNGSRVQNHIKLSWHTNNDGTLSHFEIEKSANAMDFDFLYKRAPNTGEVVSTEYQFLDHFPYEGDNYYRLKLVDHDGASRYSDIINIHFTKESTYRLYPVPVEDQLKLEFSAHDKEYLHSFKIVDLSGQIVYKMNAEQDDTFQYTANLAAYASGIYLIQIKTNHRTIIQKIYKE